MDGAIRWLESEVESCRSSSVYETPDFYHRHPAYYNAVAEGETPLGFDDLNNRLKKFELDCGRDAESRATGIVPIDLDIVVFNGAVVRPTEFEREYFTIGYRQLYPELTE